MRRAVMLVTLLCSACCTSTVHDSMKTLQLDFGTYREATAPRPDLSETERALTLELGDQIETHIDKLEELTR